LLQVVRRLAATDAPAAPNQRTTTAATTTAATTTTSVEADAARGEVMRSAARARPDAQDGDTHLGAPGGESAERAPAEHVADQFMSVLSETVRRRPAPLPTTYRPLADAIAGPRPVMLSTDSASRKALRSVGKVAATTGDTIHLDQRSIPSARLAEVMAHELTHIAHPSPTPRFFDDIDDSPEERRAEQVAKVMARSPLAPSATTSAPPTRRRRDEGTIRRSPTSGSGTVSAAALAASLTRTGGEQVQRWETATPSAKRPQIGSRRSGQTSSSSSTSTSSSNSRSQAESTSFDGPSAAAEPSAEWFRTNLDANIDRIIRLVEDRMIVELERRGGRSWRST
jgi:hypothetical protein